MKLNQFLIIGAIGLTAYLILKPKKNKVIPPPSPKPDCSAYGKVNCQVINSTNGQLIESCCCPEGQVLCGQGKDAPVGGPPPSIETKCYDPNVDYVMDPCK